MKVNVKSSQKNSFTNVCVCSGVPVSPRDKFKSRDLFCDREDVTASASKLQGRDRD